MAHGYLLHQFLSPLTNKRRDDFGGSNLFAFPLIAAVAVKAAVSPNIALGARLTGTDWSDEGITTEHAIALTIELQRIGFHYVDVTTGGINPRIQISASPRYQVPFARQIREATGIVTRAVV